MAGASTRREFVNRSNQSGNMFSKKKSGNPLSVRKSNQKPMMGTGPMTSRRVKNQFNFAPEGIVNQAKPS